MAIVECGTKRCMASSDGPDVSYALRVREPALHLVEVELRIGDAGALGDAVELSMAAWCPGSYLIRDYARHVRQLRAADGNGRELPVQKTSKHTWRVERREADEVVVSYLVYGHDLTVRTNHIDSTHAFLHGPATYVYVDALRDRPCCVRAQGPEGEAWPVVTGLPATDDGYLAENLDELFDCPIHLGEVEMREFEAAAKPTRLAVWGKGPGRLANLDRLVEDLSAIIENHARRFGGVPYSDYTFILMISPGTYGGLEHRNSSANLNPPDAFASEKAYADLLELLSHEFFHVWNGKRIYPDAFQPFDYGRESYTRCLWVIEGLTSYIDRLTVRNAGRMELERFMEKLAEEWGRLQMTPGRELHSLEEASYDAWIKLYKPDESNLNTTVSYYLKGGLVALTLDLEIRQRSGRERGLRDVLRELWERYGSRGVAYPEAEVQPVFEAAAGFSLDDFFDEYVRGRSDPDLAGALHRAGLVLEPTWDKAQKAGELIPAWLGVTTRGASATLGEIIDDSPAAAAGLSPGDQVIALASYRVAKAKDLRKQLGAHAPGDIVELALFRRGRLEVAPVQLAESPPSRYEIRGAESPSEEQQALFADWLHAEHPGPSKLLAGATITRWI